MKRKKAVVFAVILALVLLAFLTQVRVVKIGAQHVFLLRDPFHISGSSVGSDIREAFDTAGKSSSGILEITYVGTNSDGNYFACTYTETDGTVRTYYAFDDGDLNSTVRATVIWPEP